MNRKRFIAITASLCVFLFGMVLLSGPILEWQWPSLGGSFDRSGRSEDRGPVQGAVQWRFETGAGVVGSVTVGLNDRIHAACEDGKLYSLHKSGRLVWATDVNTPLAGAPTVGPDGSLYVGGKDGTLFAIDPNGRLQWTHSTGAAIYSSPAVGPDGSIYVGSTDGMLYALSRDGTQLWLFKTGGPNALSNGAIFASASVAADGTIYIGGLYDPNLYALHPADGSVKWACRFPSSATGARTGGWFFASPVVAADGTIYQTLLDDSRLYAIEPEAGTILWSVDLCDARLFGPKAAELDGHGWSEPVLGPDGTIYVSLDDPYLRAVDPRGVVKWATQLGGAGAFTLTVDRDGLVYAASEDGHVYVVTPGSLGVAQFETGGWPGFPVIMADDVLILADSRDYSSWNTVQRNAVWAISSRSLGTVVPRRYGSQRVVMPDGMKEGTTP